MIIMQILILYLVSLITSIVVAALLKMPLIQKSRPIRFSFETSILFPTPILALGIEAIFRNLFGDYITLAFFAGLFGALLSKYSDKIFGEP